MELIAWLTLVIFTATIIIVITGVIDRSVAAMLGVVIMIWCGTGPSFFDRENSFCL